MSSTRSGYIVEVPLGLWSSVGFTFVEEGDGSDDITHVEVHLVDDSGVYDLPSVLRDFAALYMKTWLAAVRKDEFDQLIFKRTGFADSGFWQEQTLERLHALVEQGHARREEDLD